MTSRRVRVRLGPILGPIRPHDMRLLAVSCGRWVGTVYSALALCWSGITLYQGECPRHESNMRTRFRKPLLYPLSYGGAWPR
jgi:hypothetical protein